ncbi:MAG: chemotaxis protein CheW [Candidatus Acidiferrales bacterium]|jgi:chemotaxis signal transduction protein
MNAPDTENVKSYVLLQIGSRRFALAASEVSELAPPVRLHQFPHKSPLVSGIIVRRGRLVPVYDVCPLLTGKDSPTHQFYLVARRHFGSASEPAAIPVNGDSELVTADTVQVTSPPYVSGRLIHAGESIEVLDLDRLVAFESRERTQVDTAELSS